MVMRLVWPDDETMPKKRKQLSPDAPPEQELPDGPVTPTDEAPPESPTEPTAEPADEPQSAPALQDAGADAATDAEDSGDADDQAEEDAAPEPAVDPAILEALLFSTHHPLTPQRLAELLDIKSQKNLKAAIHDLNKQYEETNRTFRVEQVAGGYQLLSLPEYGDILKRLHQREADAKLSKAALETLAIIAYKQPILRADVEAIRGVACGETIRSLMEKHLVNIAGRAEEPGRPILYGTTKRFLQLFGLNNLKDLPQSEQLPKPRE
jgi:segregation and condensation protein B